jgi:hypothetical protein
MAHRFGRVGELLDKLLEAHVCAVPSIRREARRICRNLEAIGRGYEWEAYLLAKARIIEGWW